MMRRYQTSRASKTIWLLWNAVLLPSRASSRMGTWIQNPDHPSNHRSPRRAGDDQPPICVSLPVNAIAQHLLPKQIDPALQPLAEAFRDADRGVVVRMD